MLSVKSVIMTGAVTALGLFPVGSVESLLRHPSVENASGPTAPVLSVSVQDVNPGSTFARDLCLTIALGIGTAAECGDLRIVHELPTTTTFGQARTPALLYNSQHADPHPVVAANVYIPSGTPALTQVEAVLLVNGSARARGVWKGSAWPASGNGRIALTFDASMEPTAIYNYRLTVTARRGTSAETQSVNGSLAVVNRKASTFGAGWWLAGLEKLVLDPSRNPSMWVGGDGSVRRYIKVSDTAWVAPSIDRPDSLRRSGSGFVRRVSGGTRVIFDSLGRHVTTRNRLNRETTFAYDSRNRLTFVTVPARDVVIVDECVTGPQGLPICTLSERVVGKSYSFLYAADGGLQQVVAPAAVSDVPPSGLPTRFTNITVRQGRLESIQDIGTLPVVFAYLRPGSTRIVARKDPNGFSARFGFDGIGKVASYDQERATGGWTLTTLRSAESVGLVTAEGSGAVDPSSAYTKLDGPRIDVADTSSFWVDRHGAPTLLRNALGYETRLSRTDSRFPGLVTEVIAPNGFVTRASYDAGGNVDTTTQVSPYGEGNAVTLYTWDRKWDLPASITLPMGERTTFAYDAVTGNRLFQQLGPDVARRVTFAYDTAGLLSTVTEPGTSTHSFGYDTNGNVNLAVNALGVRREMLTDGAGQLIRVRTPVDQSQTVFQTDTTIYDGLGRAVRVESFGPSVPGDLAKRAIVQNVFDSTGNLVRIERSAFPDEASIGVLATRYTHDELHRPTTETHGVNSVERSVYDPAGNLIKTVSRMTDPSAPANFLEIHFKYDALNRLQQRILPPVRYPPRTEGIATIGPVTPVDDSITTTYPRYPNDGARGYEAAGETAQFQYDVVGRITSATNSDARVARTYYPGGGIQSDTLRVRNAGDLAFSHIYTLAYKYDLNGRRRELVHPTNLAPSPSENKTVYAYDALTGELTTVKDALLNEFQFRYNARGELDTLVRPGPITESLRYDGLGRLRADSVLAPKVDGGMLLASTFEYDVRDKLTFTGNAVGPFDTLTSVYSGLGHVRSGRSISRGSAQNGNTAYSLSTDDILTDALGNLLSRRSRLTYRTPGYEQIRPDTIAYVYAQSTGRLVATNTNLGPTAFRYDSAGNELFRTRTTFAQSADRASWYDAAGRLRASDTRTIQTTSALETHKQQVFEEYRYDALGRRVWVRTRRWCAFDPDQLDGECQLSKVRRTVWDGTEELYEIQMPGGNGSPYLERDTLLDSLPQVEIRGQLFDPNPFFGRVSYTHALGIDQPIGITRMNYGDRFDSSGQDRGYRTVAPFTIMPLWNERGQPQIGTFDDGSLTRCTGTGSTARCVNLSWPGTWFAYMRPRFRPNFWHGTVLDDKQDAAGTHYRRARNYDPATGRFTQEDPIGLAGGINLYGFANGDPVNFSDPFGLCTPWPDCMFQGAANWGARRGGLAGGAALNVGAAANAASEAFGTNELGAAIGSGSISGTAIATAGFLPAGKLGRASKLVDGAHLPVGAALDAAADFLGAGYKELKNGRFVSGDGLRQVRMGVNEIMGKHGGGPHMNFETLAPNPAKQGKYMIVDNKHIYLTGK